MKLSYHPYLLTAAHSLNSRSSAFDRQGALLKVSREGISGYADLHPWPERGEGTLADHLQSLLEGQPSSLALQILSLAEKDRQARGAGQSLWKGKSPKNNFLVTDWGSLTHEDWNRLGPQGYESVKIKMGPRDLGKMGLLREIMVSSALRFRMDFNSSMSLSEIENFMLELGDKCCEKIEYLEDPIPFDIPKWRSLNRHFPLAIDEHLPILLPELAKNPDWSDCFRVLVYKPARMSFEDVVNLAIQSKASVTVTSMMDHPVGVAHSAVAATELALLGSIPVLDCGCQTTKLFEQDEFSILLKTEGPFILPPDGIGVGFDSQLAHLPWRDI